MPEKVPSAFGLPAITLAIDVPWPLVSTEGTMDKGLSDFRARLMISFLYSVPNVKPSGIGPFCMDWSQMERILVVSSL